MERGEREGEGGEREEGGGRKGEGGGGGSQRVSMIIKHTKRGGIEYLRWLEGVFPYSFLVVTQCRS